MRILMSGLVVSCLAAAVSPALANTTLTFEESGITAMSNAPGVAVPAGAQLSTKFLAADGVSFSSGASFVAVTYHDAVYTPSPPNVIGGTNADGTLNYHEPITATFFMPGTSDPAITDFVKVLGDLIPLGSGTVTMTAYDANGNFLLSDTDTDDQPIGQGPVLQLSIAGIHSVVLTETSGTVGFDNFEFGPLSPVPTTLPIGGAPEPSVWISLLLGLGITGTTLRRRRTLARVAAT